MSSRQRGTRSCCRFAERRRSREATQPPSYSTTDVVSHVIKSWIFVLSSGTFQARVVTVLFRRTTILTATSQRLKLTPRNAASVGTTALDIRQLRRRGSRHNGTSRWRDDIRQRRGRKMDSLGNRCSSFTPRRAFCARGFDRSCLDVFRAPVVHVAHAQNEINHVAVSDRTTAVAL